MIITGLATGLALGVVLQRGRFCVTGMLRDIFLRKTWVPFSALLIVIAIQSVGVATLTTLGVITPEADPFAPIAVVIGSLLFGAGIVLAGGCASGTWYRAGEGLVGSWIALAAYALSAAAMKTGFLVPLNSWLRSYQVSHTSLPETLHTSLWPFALLLAAGTGYLVFQFRDQIRPPAARFDTRPLWQRPLSLHSAAVLVGLIGVVAWPLSAAAGRNDGLGITTPSKNVVNYIVTGDLKFLDWGALLVLGILIGSYFAARATGEFRLRTPDGITARRALTGGILMGIGASWAGGCTVGNGMVQTSLFSYQGWLALAATAVGVAITARFVLNPTTALSTLTRIASAGGTEATNAATRDAASTHAVSNAIANGSDAQTNSATRNPSVPTFVDATGQLGINLLEAPATAAAQTDTAAQAVTHEEGNRYRLNTVGAVCPFPLIDAKAAIAELSPGDELAIAFDCTQATDTIPRWAAENGHGVVSLTTTGDASWEIVLVKDRALAAVH